MSFETNPVHLQKLLERAREGDLKLPEFQRSWVWDHERIRELIASVANGFPVGALMTLKQGGEVEFQSRPIAGAPQVAWDRTPSELLLDGQQRTTSLFCAIASDKVVETKTPRGKPIKVWFYFDIRRALEAGSGGLIDAIVMVPEDRVLPRTGKSPLDLKTTENQVKELHFPINQALDWDAWQDVVFETDWDTVDGKAIFKQFKNQVLSPLMTYQLPVISLGSDTSREAVCLVFEKVNTGGKPLDAFELVTAMYAAQRFDLRLDWQNRWDRFRQQRVLRKMESTDFLQAIALFHTRQTRKELEAQGVTGRDLAPISGSRATLLSLPLEAYKKYADQVEQGFLQSAKFLHTLHIFDTKDLPYKTQLVPLAAILADIGKKYENARVRDQLTHWYWSGVFGELYGSATDTRTAIDFAQVPDWLRDTGRVPQTIEDARFSPRRLDGMKTRVSAAYKGLAALMMAKGAADWLSGQKFEHATFFGDAVDIHHIFPAHWCNTHGIDSGQRDSIINKAPLAARTNRIIGGDAPSKYLQYLEAQHSIAKTGLYERVQSHFVDSELLAADNFLEFYRERAKALLELIKEAIGPDSIETEHGGAFDDSDFGDEDEEQEAA